MNVEHDDEPDNAGMLVMEKKQANSGHRVTLGLKEGQVSQSKGQVHL